MDLEDLRLAVYDAFRRTGRAPGNTALAELLDARPSDVAGGLRELAEARHLVLDSDGEIVMAHPFATIPLGFSVMGPETLYWGGCAWDSFALPRLLAAEMLVATTCPGCGAAHGWSIGTDASPDGDQVAHFLVPAARMWDDVVHTCGNQRLFCSRRCVEAWLARTGQAEGYVTDLATLWRFAAGWYAGRLDRGYVRREPAAAASYLRAVGLAGAFWGP